MNAEQVLELPTADLEAWVREGALSAPPGFNWLGLAEVASSVALSDVPGDDRRLALAEISLDAPRRARGMDLSLGPTAVTSEALLRAELILRLA